METIATSDTNPMVTALANVQIKRRFNEVDFIRVAIVAHLSVRIFWISKLPVLSNRTSRSANYIRPELPDKTFAGTPIGNYRLPFEPKPPASNRDSGKWGKLSQRQRIRIRNLGLGESW
jgi:hypothetical protein